MSMPDNEVPSVDFYDSLWARTHRVDQHHKCRAHAIRKFLTLILGDRTEPFKILEPGCGSGIISKTLADFGEVTGIDQSTVGIRKAKQAVTGRFIIDSLPDFEVNDIHFDVCVLSQVLEHFQNDEQVRLLRNIHSHVREGGYLIIATPNQYISSRMTFKPGELQPIENWLTLQSLTRLLESTGWHVEKVIFSFSFFPILMSRFPWLRPIRYLLYQVLHLRGFAEDLMESWGIGDCTMALAVRK